MRLFLKKSKAAVSNSCFQKLIFPAKKIEKIRALKIRRRQFFFLFFVSNNLKLNEVINNKIFPYLMFIGVVITSH